MRTILFLIAAFAGWQFLLRPWLFRRDRKSVQEKDEFRGQEIQEADFEDLGAHEDEKERP